MLVTLTPVTVAVAVTGDVAVRNGVAGREGGGGGGGSGDRDTGEQNARLAHCRVLFSQWLSAARRGHPASDGCACSLTSCHRPRNRNQLLSQKNTGVAKATSKRR